MLSSSSCSRKTNVSFHSLCFLLQNKKIIMVINRWKFYRIMDDKRSLFHFSIPFSVTVGHFQFYLFVCFLCLLHHNLVFVNFRFFASICTKLHPVKHYLQTCATDVITCSTGYNYWCLFMCNARWSDLEKLLSHWMHLKGFKPVCLRWCRVNSSDLANLHSHPSHEHR